MKELNKSENKIELLGTELLMLMNHVLSGEMKDSSMIQEITCYMNNNSFRLLRSNDSCVITMQLNFED